MSYGVRWQDAHGEPHWSIHGQEMDRETYVRTLATETVLTRSEAEGLADDWGSFLLTVCAVAVHQQVMEQVDILATAIHHLPWKELQQAVQHAITAFEGFEYEMLGAIPDRLTARDRRSRQIRRMHRWAHRVCRARVRMSSEGRHGAPWR